MAGTSMSGATWRRSASRMLESGGKWPMLPPSDAPRIAIGVDTVEIARIIAATTRYDERFLNRVFTAYERERYANRPLALAGRFAAKEATAKALGTGIGPVGWHGIEIR